MRIRMVFAAAATLLIAACGDSTTGPEQLKPGARSNDEIVCRSGYHVATRADGTQYCEVDGIEGGSLAAPTDP